MLLVGSTFEKLCALQFQPSTFTLSSKTLHSGVGNPPSASLTLKPVKKNLPSAALRITVVTEAFLPQVNGVTNSVLRLLEFARSQGHEVLIIAPESEGAPKEYLGYRIKHVPSVSMKNLIPMGLPQRSLEPLIEGFAPDVIHLASPIFLGHSVTKIAKRLNIPTVSIYQTDIAGFARHYKLTIAHSTLKKWISRIHQDSDLTLAPSSWSCRDLAENGVNNIRLWKRGVDIERFDPRKADSQLRNQLNNGSQKKIVGYVGRLANEKRVDDLAILDQQEDIQLVIVGDGPATSKLKRALPNAIFAGHQSGDSLARYVATFDLFVHTGKHETFCQAIQEALASGTPVVGPDTGGPVDLITHGRTGLLVDTSHPEALLAAARAILYSEEYAAMKTFARDSVEHRTWGYINNQLIGHYRDAIIAKKLEKELVA
jgi:phosphatidylinositol alpha 1,6-mannosyltransferase